MPKILDFFVASIFMPYQYGMEHFNKETMTMDLLRSEETMDV